MSAPTDTSIKMIQFTLDGRSVAVPKGTTVYNAAKQNGIEIPIFCYHDRMPPFGACRMCLVEVEKMPKLQASCTLEATEGMVVKTQSKMAEEGRQGILEFLLINHPLDCPICDRGGECPLQDNTLKFGPGQSRFFEPKRRFVKPIPLGPVLMLDRERCIVCARCTRFGEIIAGDHALEFIERGYKTEVGTPDGGPADSKFIGNTIQICPVGALTSQVYRFRARPWDNHPTKSTCTLCPVGCSMILDSRDGEIMRTRSYEDKNVNDVWLCDKGWFGYQFTSHSQRLEKPLIRRSGNLEPATWDEALSLIVSKIREFKPQGKLAGLGGNPLTTEENYLFQKLMRKGAGVNHVDHRVGTPIIPITEEGLASGMEISIGECENLSFAVLLGLDLTEEFPLIWLRLRQAINRGAKTLFLGYFAPEIAQYINKVVVHTPGKEDSFLKEYLPKIRELVETGKRGALFVGSQYLANPNRAAILSELLKFQQEVPGVSLNLLEGRGNSMGARLAGMRPDVGPLGESLNQPGLDSVGILKAAASSGWDFLYVAGANPACKSSLWKEAREKLGFLVVQDLFLTETASQADVVLPTLSYVEKSGHFVNIEGRVQQLQPGKDIPKNIYSDADIFIRIAARLNLTFDQHFPEALRPGRLPFARPERIERVADLTKWASGDLMATFAPALFDHGVRMKHNTQLVQLAKEPRLRIHPQEAIKRGFQEGEKVRVIANGGSLEARLKLDSKVAEGTLVIPLGFEEVPAHQLGANLLNGLPVEVTKW